MVAKVIALFAGFALAFAYAQPTQIEVWFSLGRDFGQPEFEELVAEFNEAQDEIEVTQVYAGGYTDTLRRAEAALAAGTPPESSMFEQTRGAGFVDAGAILTLDELIAADPEVNVDDFFERLLLTCTIDDQLWCIPYNTSTPLLYYNADMFRAVGLDPDEDFPSTWEELLEIGPLFAERGGGGELERWAFGLRTDPGWAFDAFLGQAGGRFLNEAGDEFIFNDESALHMAEFWLSLVEEDIAVPMSASRTEDEFFAGNQAILYQSTALLDSFLGQADFDIRVAPLWCDVECYAPIGGANFYIFDTGDEAKQQAAWEFLKWVTSGEPSARFSMATGYHAPRMDTLEMPMMQEHFEVRPEARVTYDQMEEYGHSRTLVPFWGEVHSLLTVASEQILLEGVPPQQALDEAVEEANRLLRAYAR